ncbi:MAG: hypothetical protein FJ213_13405 [Ignavibacteria bacterium]|nr:hypothetical protein [Ignavibacteria bacterium]
MKKIIIVLLPFVLISCASFNPGTIEYRSAITSPGSKQIDSVYTFVKEYNNQEAKLIFDTDFRYYDFEPIYISVFNRSNSTILVDPLNVENRVNIDEVYKKTKSAPFGYFIGWSIPWGINMLAGLHFFYGIAWPVFGVAAMAKTSGANRKREDYYNSVTLKKTELLSGQEINGVVFIENDSSKTIKLNLIKNDSIKIIFLFDKMNKKSN